MEYVNALDDMCVVADEKGRQDKKIKVAKRARRDGDRAFIVQATSFDVKCW